MPDLVRVGSLGDFADGHLHAAEAAGTHLVVAIAGDSVGAARTTAGTAGTESGPGA